MQSIIRRGRAGAGLGEKSKSFLMMTVQMSLGEWQVWYRKKQSLLKTESAGMRVWLALENSGLGVLLSINY